MGCVLVLQHLRHPGESLTGPLWTEFSHPCLIDPPPTLSTSIGVLQGRGGIPLSRSASHPKHACTLGAGTDADSGYFKFLRWKLRFTELALLCGVDVLMADVDVLVLSPNFLIELTKYDEDLVVSSDARKGSYDDQVHCPMSQPMYQHYSHDWVCAGLYYIRATHAGKWFMREVQSLMDEFTITDQDAMQAVLTGHTQVPIMSPLL